MFLPYARLLEHVFAKKMSFDMKKVLLLTGKRWKKEEPPERECFSDEDSDEEDSEYGQIVIAKKKQAKRKLRAKKPQVPRL